MLVNTVFKVLTNFSRSLNLKKRPNTDSKEWTEKRDKKSPCVHILIQKWFMMLTEKFSNCKTIYWTVSAKAQNKNYNLFLKFIRTILFSTNICTMSDFFVFHKSLRVSLRETFFDVNGQHLSSKISEKVFLCAVNLWMIMSVCCELMTSEPKACELRF